MSLILIFNLNTSQEVFTLRIAYKQYWSRINYSHLYFLNLEWVWNLFIETLGLILTTASYFQSIISSTFHCWALFCNQVHVLSYSGFFYTANRTQFSVKARQALNIWSLSLINLIKWFLAILVNNFPSCKLSYLLLHKQRLLLLVHCLLSSCLSHLTRPFCRDLYHNYQKPLCVWRPNENGPSSYWNLKSIGN